MAENLLLLAYETKESLVCAEEKIAGEKVDLTKEGGFVLPPDEEDEEEEGEDKQPLIWRMNKPGDGKEKGKMSDTSVQVIRSYSTGV